VYKSVHVSHKRDANRNFVLDRMQNVKILDQKYELKGEIDVERLIFSSNESGTKIEVHVYSPADRAFRANLPTKIIKEEVVSDEIIKVTFKFENLDYINEWLLQFGTNVEILSPKKLKVKREGLLKKMMMKLNGK